MNRFTLRICAVALAMTAVGCGKGFNSATPAVDGLSAKSAVPQIDMAHLEQSAVHAQDALSNIQSTLGQFINQNGSFNFGSLFGGVNFGDISTCVQGQFSANQLLFLPQDIANALTCVTSRVVTVATAAKTEMTNASAQLTAALALVPVGSAEAIEIQAMLTEINQLQTSYVTIVHSLATQISMANTFLNQLPSLATSVCPISVPGLNMICGGAVSLLLAPVQTAITNFQSQLASL